MHRGLEERENALEANKRAARLLKKLEPSQRGQVVVGRRRQRLPQLLLPQPLFRFHLNHRWRKQVVVQRDRQHNNKQRLLLALLLLQ